ncbi:hypothetical protein D3C77_594130 [compost metagenome]
MRFFKKGQVRRAVHSQQGLQPRIFWLDYFKAEVLRGLQQMRGTLRDFLRGAHLAARVVTAGMMQQLFRMKVATHGLLLMQLGQRGPVRR